MKNIILSVFFTSLFLAGFTEAAAVYNKDGTKLNLYGLSKLKSAMNGPAIEAPRQISRDV